MFEQVLPGNTKAILALLEKSEAIQKAYLAGGTGLALQLGHRNLAAVKMHLMKSLVYFEDAESDEMPEMLKKVSRGAVKKCFENEVRKLVRRYD